ncbi:MAG: cytidylyltransferase domain-containing protein [Ilumatobacteraceae bacterium]
MIGDKRVLTVVPARGGSKGIPGKNLKVIAGRSLLHRTIDQALASNTIDDVVVTSDDPEILRHAGEIDGVRTIERPRELAADDTAMWPVVMHALDHSPACDVVVLLQPTSPLRLPSDIDRAVTMLAERKANSVMSVCEVATSPYWMFTIDGSDKLQRILPKRPVATRQELPPCFEINGALYVVTVEWFRASQLFVDDDTLAYVMPRERSVDVDTPEDLATAERLLHGA